MRWYVFNQFAPSTFELISELDLKRIPAFASKDDAKNAAAALGLKTWRYVRLKA